MSSLPKQTAQHTPTPWYASVDPSGWYVAASRCPVANCDGPATREEAEANAAFIVRACNSHADLLAALREFLAADISGDREVRLHGARAQARAAIARATQ